MPESLRLYSLCKAMRWTHLPVSGGLYDQHPKLIDDFMTIMEVEHTVEKRKQALEKQQSRTKAKGRKGR